MGLPADFQFSQGSLQDYVDCPRRFQLKYLQRLAWPALEAEPALENERYTQQGAAFHRLVQQFFAGVPAERLSRFAGADAQLAGWWQNFSREAQQMARWQDAQNYAEISFSAPIGAFRLVGKYDLLSISEAKFTIYDWKTARKLPKREWVASSLQTRVYPYLLAKAGAHLNGGQPIAPGQIALHYWFANFPGSALRFPYSAAQFAADEAYLGTLIAEIAALPEGEAAPLTASERRCRYCVYRSLCSRGTRAGPLAELEDDEAGDLFGFELDFEQIAEIEF